MAKRFIILILLLALPSAASAATLGDILRTSFSLPYLADTDSRLAFPDKLTVDSWGSPVATEVDVSVLAEKRLVGVMPLRSGSHLVKFGSDPKVYAVGQNGTLHWIMNESIAKTLYGHDWNSRVTTLFSSFLPNYKIGATLSVPIYPEGTVFKRRSSPTVYYLTGGVARPFLNEAAFYANGLGWDEVITVSATHQLTTGLHITGHEFALQLQSI